MVIEIWDVPKFLQETESQIARLPKCERDIRLLNEEPKSSKF